MSSTEQPVELQKHLPHPCRVEELFTHETPVDATQEKILKALEDYLSHFCAPVRLEGKRFCHKCGGEFNGMLAMIGLTNAVGFEWGLAHGEGHCSGCRWPMRGHHSVKDPETGEEILALRNLPLAYLPELVTEKVE